jgi:hypothetical protein
MAKIQLFLILTLLSGLMFGFQSCGKGGAAGAAGDLTNRIPATATMVFTCDVGQLLTKADFEKIKSSALYKKVVSRAPEATRELMADPALIGLDLKGKWAGFVEINDINEDDVFAAFMMPIADKAKWEGLTKRAEEKNTKKAVQKTGYKVVILEDDAYLAWDEKLAVFGVGKRSGDDMSASAQQQLDKVFKPAGANIQSNASFKKQNAEKRDILFWASTDEMFKKMLSGPDAGQIKMASGMLGLTDAAFVGNSLTAYHDFQNGKIESAISYEFSPELREKFGKVFNEGQKGDYAKYLPAQDLSVLMGASINLEELHKVLEAMNMSRRFDSQLADLNLSSKEVLGALKGEGLIGIYFNIENNEPDFIFVAGVNDKTNVAKLLEVSSTLRMAEIKGDRFEAGLGFNKAYGYIGSDVFAFSNKVELVDKIASGGFGADATKADAVKTIQSGWAGLAIVGFQFMQQATGDLIGYDADQAAKDKVTAIFTNEITSVVAVAKANKATNTVSLKTSNKNALARWFELLEEIYQIRKSPKNVQ